jgi:hypothetical protein
VRRHRLVAWEHHHVKHRRWDRDRPASSGRLRRGDR